MKILLSSSSPFYGGSGISAYARNLAFALEELGHTICLLSTSDLDGTQNSHVKGRKHCVIGQYDFPINALTIIEKFCKDNCIEAIINNDNAFLQTYAQICEVPFISISHMRTSSVISLACAFIERVDYVVAISNDMRQVLSKKYNVPTMKLPVIYNGVPFIKTNTTMQAGPKVIFVGGENKKKGADILLSAIKASPKSWDGVRLIWCGNVSDDFAAEAKKLKKDIVFKGRLPQEELFKLYYFGDVFLLPSRLEGCPMALLEAMNYGLVPVCCNGYGAMDHIVTNGREGYILEHSCFKKEVSECLQHLMSKNKLRENMARSSIERIRKEFLSSDNAQSIEGLLKMPTVDRTSKPERITILNWHRKVKPGFKKMSLLGRIQLKLGLLSLYRKNMPVSEII